MHVNSMRANDHALTERKKMVSVLLVLALVFFISPLSTFNLLELFVPIEALAGVDGGLPNVSIGDNGLVVEGADFTGDQSAWDSLFARYRSLIIGISGFATLTMLGAFIFLFAKLGATSGNEKARRDCITGILFTGIATALLGSVTIVMGFFYNSFRGL